MITPQLESFILFAIATALGIGLLVLAFKLLRSIANTLKPAAVVVGFVVIGLVGLQFVQQRLSAQQKDQVEKFLHNLGEQVRELMPAGDAQPTDGQAPSQSPPDQQAAATDSQIGQPRSMQFDVFNQRIELRTYPVQ